MDCVIRYYNWLGWPCCADIGKGLLNCIKHSQANIHTKTKNSIYIRIINSITVGVLPRTVVLFSISGSSIFVSC
jgi:uncharacterized membrane protein YqhA